MLHYVSGTLSLMKSGHPTPSYSSNHLVKPFLFQQSYTFYLYVCMCVCVRASDLSHSVRVSCFVLFFFNTSITFFNLFCFIINRPCAPKEKWHRKEHIIITYMCTISFKY